MARASGVGIIQLEQTNFNQFEMSKTDIEAESPGTRERKNIKRRDSLPVKGEHQMKVISSKNYAKTQNSHKRMKEPSTGNPTNMFESDMKVKKVRLSNKYAILRKKR